MAIVDWSQATKFYNRVNALIQASVTRSDWIGFMDALGWMENDGKYGGLGVANNSYAEIYQVGDAQLSYMDFLSGMGGQFLGIPWRYFHKELLSAAKGLPLGCSHVLNMSLLKAA